MVFLSQLVASPFVKVELAEAAFELTSTDHTASFYLDTIPASHQEGFKGVLTEQIPSSLTYPCSLCLAMLSTETPEVCLSVEQRAQPQTDATLLITGAISGLSPAEP